MLCFSRPRIFYIAIFYELIGLIMQMLIYGLMILSGLLGLGVTVFGCLLGWVFRASISDTDQMIGWLMIVLSLVYLAHPALSYGLMKNAHVTASLIFSLVMILLSVGLLFFLPSAMDVAARP